MALTGEPWSVRTENVDSRLKENPISFPRATLAGRSQRETKLTATSPSVPTIHKLNVERYRGIKHLMWHQARGVSLIPGGGDVGKTTILDVIGLLLSPTEGRHRISLRPPHPVSALPPHCHGCGPFQKKDASATLIRFNPL